MIPAELPGSALVGMLFCPSPTGSEDLIGGFAHRRSSQMPVHNSARHLAALLIILRIAVGSYSQDQRPYLTHCSDDNFTASSPYESNLRRLISDLVSSTPASPSYFSRINSTTSPIIYGLAQCRPDVNSTACAACLKDTASAAHKSKDGCALKTSGYLRYDSCLLIYSDKNFYTTPQEPIFDYDLVPQNLSSHPFDLHIQTQLYTVMLPASKNALRFEAQFAAKTSADLVDIYTMGWCSMDLSTDDCFDCLKKVSGFFPGGKSRGTCATVSCVVKYDTYQFYGSIMIPAVFSAGKNNNTTVIAVISGAVAFLLLFTLFALLLQRRIRKLKASNIRLPMDEELSNIEIKMIDFSALKKATNNFAIQNKLGQGGFGPVYKGLLNGLEIAVKRLSATSLQGLQEMKNEIQFVANLRHKNLVRLLGYCIHGEEKILIYEFLPNTSLDKFLFNPIRKTQLDWETRLKIIVGVGRGLLYLHEDSHLRMFIAI